MKGSAVSNGVSTELQHDAAGPLDTHGLSREDLLRAYRTMVLSRRIDDKEIQLKNQSLIYFQISGAGHEAILVAAGMQLKAGHDWFYPYYRDRALCLAVGMTPYEMLLAAVGSKDDPASGGRQMPSHWGHKDLNIVSQSSPTGTQCLQAIGCAEAALLYDRITAIEDRDARYRRDEVTYLSLGDGTTSEGEFWESLNSACLGHLPIVFVVEDNGYAISVPVEVQTAGGDISRLVSSFPDLLVQSIDGTDFLASYEAMGNAIAYARARKGPALVHAKVIRPYSHSLSDDEKLYKTPVERAEESTRDPLVKLAELLKAERLATDEDLAAIRHDVDREVNDAADRAVQAPKPNVDTVSLYVFSPDVDPTSESFSTPAAP
jgi:2-oxoisovalerate dehydrogenase E1 component